MGLKNVTWELDEHNFESINAKQHLLFCDIVAWCARCSQHMPSTIDSIPVDGPEEEQEPEDICLYLPSDFTPSERQKFQLNDIACVELELQKGEANDTVCDLHTQINFKLGLESQKRWHMKFTKDITQAAKIIQDAENEKISIATVYRSARDAIVALGGDGVEQYPPLTAKDLAAKSVRAGTDHGKGKQTDSWVFTDSQVLTGDSISLQEWDLDSE